MYCIFIFLGLALILLKFSLSMFFVLLCKTFFKFFSNFYIANVCKYNGLLLVLLVSYNFVQLLHTSGRFLRQFLTIFYVLSHVICK